MPQRKEWPGAERATESRQGGDAIELQPFYHAVKDSLLQPRQVVVGTRYFWDRWAPRLGPTLAVLIIRLRLHCYYNRATGERRDSCFPTQQTLAEEIGVSRWTVMRELKRPEARLFVRVQHRSRYDTERRQTVRISSLYHVAMDDPLVEEDRGRAALLVTEQLLEKAAEVHDSHCGIEDPGREVEERPFTGEQARRVLAELSRGARVQSATAPKQGNLPPEKEPKDNEIDDADAIARELIREDVSPSAARRLASSFPAERIREKMSLVRQLKEQRQSLRNPAGFLCRAIEDDYRIAQQATGTDDVTSAPLLQLRGAGPGRSALSVDVKRRGKAVAETAVGEPDAREAGLPEALSGRGRNVDVWEAAKKALESGMRPAAYAQWLAGSSLLHYAPGQVSIVVRDDRVQRYLDQRLRVASERVLAAVCGGPTRLEIIVEGEDRQRA